MEHPEISWIERTGYPSYNQPTVEYCEICGIDMESLDIYCDESHDCLCKDCLLSRHKRDDGFW